MRAPSGSSADRTLILWLAVGWTGFLVLPWYDQFDSFWTFRWLASGYPLGSEPAPALIQGLLHGKPWLLPIGIFLFPPLAVLGRLKGDRLRSDVLIVCGAGGLLYTLGQGFAIGIQGFEYETLERLFGPVDRQFGMGYGALSVCAGFLFGLTHGLAGRGAVNGDVFVVGTIGAVVALVAAFIFFPVFSVLTNALQDSAGNLAPALFADRITDQRIWGLGCITGGVRCGTAWNTLLLGVLTGLSTTLLGLAFALIVTRTGFPYKRMLRALTVLPIITPPFVVGLAIILLFGRAGLITQLLAYLFGIEPTRWIYGLPGIWLAQTLAFTPIAFLVLIGVVEGVSPSMEEAAQTLRADPWRTFTTVSLPLMRPGFANAFLLAFIESLADFGNPLILGGRFDVLATEIYFAIVGAQHDPGRAAVLAIVLLAFTLGAFFAQNRWLGRKGYTTVTGKGDSGVPVALPTRLNWLVFGTALPWAGLTIVIYVLILFGGFVELWGYDHAFTLRHYAAAFSITTGQHGLVWSGAAWNSFWTTLQVAGISAVPTALIGLITAYLLARQRFAGKALFEFGTMLSFAIPGTVIGVSYIIAFNVPPIELTGTGIILIIAFVFRNMPVGVRAGIATLAQLDKSLDEASLTLGANSFTTFRRVVFPLLRPALVAALVYSFVSAMTAVSAVVFLVSARYDMATTYILGRVEGGDYGLAIAYSSILIVVMLVIVTAVQMLLGQRRLGRREREAQPVAAMAGG